MNLVNELLSNRVLVAGICGWASAQIIKAILYTVLNKEFRLERLFGDGGMPSGHSATVSAMAMMSLLHYGVGSFEFAVSTMLAIIVMHDAMGVRLETGKQAEVINELTTLVNWLAMWIFLGAIAVVALLGADSDLRPSFGGKPLSMVLVIQMFMLLTGALIIILTKTNPASISKNEVFRSGMIAIVAVYGIAWMAETMFGAHMSEIQGVLGEMVKEYPWRMPLFCCWFPSL